MHKPLKLFFLFGFCFILASCTNSRKNEINMYLAASLSNQIESSINNYDDVVNIDSSGSYDLVNKIILGNPNYGYEWPSSSGEKGASTTGGGSAVIFSNAEAKALSYGKKWDTDSQTPWYRYQNPDWFQAWYDDSLSLSKKYDFVIEKIIGGIG